ncbi:hypothetical protein [Streptomyces sp. NPDC005012]|uniref:hypothetical protein n=1 Tax=Streptomyces sp. NPDC005012 TaxID=3154558 RepID=UPI0033BD63DA
MKAQESHISVALVRDLAHYPHEVWDLRLGQLDMFTEEVIEELDRIAWAEGNEYPNYSAISAKTGKFNWGASSSFSEILMELSTNAGGAVVGGAVILCIKSTYEKLISRARGDVWKSMPSVEEAVGIGKSRLNRHYDVAVEKLTLIRTDVDAEAQCYEFEFTHEDGRKFKAIVGAIKGIPSCTRVSAEGANVMPRPAPEPPDSGN